MLPSDLGLPFPSFQPHQLETAEAIASSPARFHMLQADTGSGKSCVYHAAARGLNVEAIDSAVVTVRVLVDAAGKATRIQIIDNPGHGFGDTAKTCTLKAAFEAARDASGRPVAGDALMRIRFER